MNCPIWCRCGTVWKGKTTGHSDCHGRQTRASPTGSRNGLLASIVGRPTSRAGWCTSSMLRRICWAAENTKSSPSPIRSIKSLWSHAQVEAFIHQGHRRPPPDGVSCGQRLRHATRHHGIRALEMFSDALSGAAFKPSRGTLRGK